MSVNKELDQFLVDSDFDHQRFLPLDILDQEISQERIRADLPFKSLLNRGLAERIFKDARKIYAILVLIGKPDVIQDVFQEGLKDLNLPLHREEGAKGMTVVSHTGEIFKLDRILKRMVAFMQAQWVTQAPMIINDGQHIVLNEKAAFPIVEIQMVGNNYSCCTYKCKLHLAHQTGYGNGTEALVCLKEFRQERSFNKQKQGNSVMRGLQHPHLIKHFTTCNRGNHFYSILPWANGGNLMDFWDREDSRTRSPELLLWCLEQILGLAEALEAVHGIGVHHGGINPSNILHFISNGEQQEDRKGILVFADLGMPEKYHSVSTTTSYRPSASDKYEPPEVMQGSASSVSSKYDIWSLGCVFLEFSLWLLYNNSEVHGFQLSRDVLDHGLYRTRAQGTLKIHSAVTSAIEKFRVTLEARRIPR